MRLTLRTLLAYLDDVLEPAEAKEIGKKVQESPLATALVSRIREVMRRRRLGAPDLNGPGIGIDPNLVAQYLDNTLPPEQVAEIEKICLESDQQLAEVAACHQILTIAQGEPVEISPSHRERLYVLGPVEAGERLETAGEAAAHNNGAAELKAPVSVHTVPGSAGPSFEESLPEYLRPKPWSGRVLTIAAGLLVIAVWLGVLYSDQNLMNRLMGLRSVPQPKPSTVAVQTQPAGDAVVIAPAEEPVELPEPDAAPPAQVAAVAPKEDVAPQEEDLPADAAAELVVLEPAAKPEADAPQALPPMTVQYVAQEGILLQQHADKGWYVVPKQANLKPAGIFACPEPFEAVLEIDQGALRATLLGDTIVELIGGNDQTAISLRLIRGRMILNAKGRDAKFWPLGLLIGPQSGVLQFNRADSSCGVEYLLREPSGFEQPVSPLDRPEGLYVLAGFVEWQPRNEPPRIASKGIALKLLSDHPPQNFGSSPPDWLDPQRRKSGSLLRRYAKKFEEEFESNHPIDSAMRALMRDPRSKISELSVRCLALCDDYAAVVKGLAQADHEDVRKAAMSGIKLWLGAEPERGPLLVQTLQTFYERDNQVQVLSRLLWGISVQDAKSPQKSEELVEWLRSDKVEIRELAFANLVRLTGRTFGYQPLASETQNRAAVKRWSDFVQREGSLVKSDEPAGKADSE